MEEIAAEATKAVACPTIGIGASASCDGQILVTEDMLGLFERTPRFVKRYGDLAAEIGKAAAAYAADVQGAHLSDRGADLPRQEVRVFRFACAAGKERRGPRPRRRARAGEACGLEKPGRRGP